MTAAALEAAALRDCLTQGSQSLAPRFFAEASKIIDTPWQIAAGNDLRHPRLSQHQSALGRFMNWYIGKVHHAGAVDPTVACAFLRVANLMEPPTKLFAGDTLRRVVRANLRPRRSAPQVAPPVPRKPPVAVSKRVSTDDCNRQVWQSVTRQIHLPPSSR